MSSSDTDDEAGSMPELSRYEAKRLSKEHRSLFSFFRPLIHGALGRVCFGGPDTGTASRFLSFCSDPGKWLLGSPTYNVLCPRLNLLQADPLFQADFRAVCAAAIALLLPVAVLPVGGRGGAAASGRGRGVGAALAVPPFEALNTPVGIEIMAELATMFVLWSTTQDGTPYDKPLSLLFSSFRSSKNTLLRLSPAELKTHQVRSLVTLVLEWTTSRLHTTIGQLSDPTTTAAIIPRVDLSPVPFRKDARVEKQVSRKPKYPAVHCTKCNGIGHFLPKCPGVPPGCNPSWPCSVCGGKGHSARFCPSE